MKRHKLQWLLVLLLCSLSSLCSAGVRDNPFTAQELDWIKQHPVVKFAGDPHTRPFEYIEDGKYKGLAAEYLAAVARRSGLRFAVVATANWEEAERAFVEGKIDLLPSVSAARISEDVKGNIKLTDPYYVSASILVTRADAPVVLSPAGLEGKVLGLRERGFYASVVAQLYPKIKLLQVREPGDPLELVDQGTAYAAVGPESVLLPLVRRQYAGKLGISGAFSDLQFSSHMGVRGDSPELYSIIAKSLASMSAEETDLINERWFEQADYGAPSLLSIAKYRAPALALVAAGILLLGWLAYRSHLARQAAQSSERAKAQFLAVMSHEIRTPLNAILGNLELLAHAPLDEIHQDRLGTIRSSSDGLVAIINDILDFSKIEAGQLSIEQIEFDLIDVVERALIIFSANARKRGIALFAAIESSTCRLRSDPARVEQIINNLLSNAVKFTPNGKVTLRVAVRSEKVAGSQLVISVEDTGIGMSPVQQRWIFSAFSQADSSIHRRFGGSGLGLALSLRLANALGGDISVTSQAGVGSCFELRLPLGDPKPSAGQFRTFAQESIIFVASAVEWHELVVPHLVAWGLDAAAYRTPQAVTSEKLDAARVLVICGERGAWEARDENRLVEEAKCVIDCQRDGPAQPVRTGRVISLSCYALKGLNSALGEALHGTQAQSAASPKFKLEAPATLPRRLRVLVAEDNVVNQQLFVEQLTILGCEPRVVVSGVEAIKALEDASWDMLLTDLNMPGMSGYELAALARGSRPELPIMAVTANASLQEHQRCQAVGIQRVLTKPLSLRGLHEVLLEVANAAHVSVAAPENADRSVLGGQAIPQHLHDLLRESSKISLRVLEDARLNGNEDALIAELHSMSGALNVFGQRSLARQCQVLERQVKEQGLAGQDDALIALEGAVRKLCEDTSHRIHARGIHDKDRS